MTRSYRAAGSRHSACFSDMAAISYGRLCLALVALAAGGDMARPAVRAAGGESQIAVIASNFDRVSAIDGNRLRNIYLRKIFLNADDRAYVPVNLPPVAWLRSAFSSAILHMNASQLQTYWDRQYFQGISPPYVLKSQAAVAKFVAVTPGAIGYVQPCFLTPKVHVILLIPIDSTSAGSRDKCPPQAAR